MMPTDLCPSHLPYDENTDTAYNGHQLLSAYPWMGTQDDLACYPSQEQPRYPQVPAELEHVLLNDW